MKKYRAHCLSLAVAVALTHASTGASALDLEHFLPHLNGRGMFNTESSQTLSKYNFGVGLFIHQSTNVSVPLALAPPMTDAERDRVAFTLVAAFGLTDWLEVGAAIPLGVWLNTVPELPGNASLGAFGTMRFQLKLRILQQKAHGIGLAFIPMFRLPTGVDSALIGEPFAFSPMLAVERAFGPVRLLLNLGITNRSRQTLGSLVVDDEFFYRFAAGYKPAKWVELGAELVGATALTGADAPKSPMELLLGARFHLLKDAVFTVGLGPGLTNGYGAPDVRFFAGLVYSPSGGPSKKEPPKDTDKDGVLDKDDRCPKTPGPKANQGCPWPDTDNDGVLDKDDRCPKVPGPKENQGCPLKKAPPPVAGDMDRDGVPDAQDRCPKVPGPAANGGCPYPDTDKDGLTDNVDNCPRQPGPASNQGCPVQAKVIVTKTEVVIREKIQFRFASAALRPSSAPILDAVVSTLKQFPDLRVEIQGHTDDIGSDESNMRLSNKRAASVRGYLTKKGIDAGRLISRGYGESRPLVPVEPGKMSAAALKAARAKNRRVQFLILKK